jgi:glycosyltransferase involved in cell wall biosynthesis
MVKNHAMLLDAWQLVCVRWPAAMLLVVGDGPERRSLQERAAGLGVGRNVAFLGDREDVPRLLQAVDFHVLASRSEGTSLTLLEAMASGRASIATTVGGNSDVLTHGRTGLLVQSGDAEAFAAAIAVLAADPARARRMGERAAADFERRFTLATMVARYESIYASAAAVTP